jgi:hypothetical protein
MIKPHQRVNLFFIFVQLIYLTALVGLSTQGLAQDNESLQKPWLSNQWVYVNHSRTVRYLETQSSQPIGTLISKQVPAYFSSPFSLRSEWYAWERIHKLLNKTLDNEGVSLHQTQNTITTMDMKMLCAHWSRFRHFLALNQLTSRGMRAKICPKLNQFIEKYINADFSIIYVSSLIQNPSSIFGHLILGIQGDKHESMLERELAFTFSIPKVKSISHALGLFFREGVGHYRLHDFQMLIDHYQRKELRDIWLYPLKLNRNQKEALLSEIWSMLLVKDTYSFLSSNCASKLAYIIALVTKNYHRFNQFAWPHAPLELIQQLYHARLIEDVQYLPSLYSQAEGLGVLKQTQSDTSISHLEYERLQVELNKDDKLPSELMTEREEHLKAISLSSDFRQDTINNHPHISIPRPYPHDSLPYPRIGVRSSINVSNKDFTFQGTGRWRGQDFSERSNSHSIAHRSWRVFEVELDINPSPYQRNLRLNDLTFLEFLQRPSKHDRSWAWDFNLSYRRGLYSQILFGETWHSQPQINTPVSSSSDQTLDRSQLFTWTKNTNSKANWQTSLLSGISYQSCPDQQSLIKACISPVALDLKWHSLFTFGPLLSPIFIFNEWSNQVTIFPNSTSIMSLASPLPLLFTIDWRLVLRPAHQRTTKLYTFSLVLGGELTYTPNHMNIPDLRITLGIRTNR